MRTLLLLLLLTFSTFAQKIPDNLKHLMAGTVISLAVGDITYQISDRVALSVGTAFAVGVGAGITKELWWDRHLGRGTYSKLDMIDTAVGSTVGSFGLFIYIMHKKDREREKIQELKLKYE